MMGQKSFARIATLSVVSIAAAIVASTPTKADDVKMGYINKMGEHPWFVSEVAGAKAEAGKLGVNLMTQDVQFDANLALTTFDTMVGDGSKRSPSSSRTRHWARSLRKRRRKPASG